VLQAGPPRLHRPTLSQAGDRTMRQGARDHHRKLSAMRAVPTPRPTTARSRRWTNASSSKDTIRPPLLSTTAPPAARPSPPAPAPAGHSHQTNPLKIP
jgi:hypothetical protein